MGRAVIKLAFCAFVDIDNDRTTWPAKRCYLIDRAVKINIDINKGAGSKNRRAAVNHRGNI
jgi:hypothetical protein